LTTHRQLAEDAIGSLKVFFPTLPASKSQHCLLPGASLGDMSFQEYQKQALERYNWLDKNLVMRFLKSYGTQTEKLLEGCHQVNDLGKHFGFGLYQREVDYLCQNEWAEQSLDILFRRTKLGLFFSKSEISLLDAYLQGQG
jgi:glycerol-3-phosphate dehydrogenase